MSRPQKEMDALASALQQARIVAQNALESLIYQTQREISNLCRFNDNRMLVATADLKQKFDQVEEAAQSLEDAFNALDEAEKWEPEDGTEDNMYTLGLESRGAA